MAVSVKKITLWRREIEDRPGSLARVLAPLAEAGTSLQVVMGYRYPEPAGRAAVELAPVAGKKGNAAAQAAGLSPSTIGAVLVEGDDRPGLGRTLSDALGQSGINLHFLMALVSGRRYTAVFGFGSDAEADRAIPIIKKSAGTAAARPRARAGRAGASRKGRAKRR